MITTQLIYKLSLLIPYIWNEIEVDLMINEKFIKNLFKKLIINLIKNYLTNLFVIDNNYNRDILNKYDIF